MTQLIVNHPIITIFIAVAIIIVGLYIYLESHYKAITLSPPNSGILVFTKKDITNNTQKGVTAFHEAAAQGLIAMMRYILDQGFDINTKNDIGGTALMLGLTRRKPKSVRFLLENGANPNIILSSPNKKFSSIGLSVENLLSAQDSGKDDLAMLDKENIKLLIQHGADVDVSLKLSSEYGSEKVYEYIQKLKVSRS